jgi:hypothetical protein
MAVPASVRLPERQLGQSLQSAHQQSASTDAWGFDPDIVSQFDSYGTLLGIGHFESVVRSRYPERTAPAYAFAGRLEWALAAELGLAVERVQKLRKQLSACRRGKRPRKLR